ncbi:glucuronate isomerase [Gracilimonas mengyeensis]|uniref:Uronate isomerase n=1 Tax=Gracilimonas mengyeensis TaxID=1302730 RepID=A0A521FDT5_9BACT|nr:glucuronate isomerase [Gracilimonas mengyeensis]SMO94164.1 D-glucuronate isomerase [Gracilimonas mengyeensis]
MKKPFIDDDFLLQSESARKLYHEYSEDEPIVDYHCHLSPKQIAEDINFRNLTHIWLDGDHYKWRAMRTCGVDEKYITGDASDKEKFLAWAKTVPKTLKNPLYHWTHMELKNPFGITDRLLNGETAEEIWEKCNQMLSLPEFSTRALLRRNKVKVVGTTDDPTDNLEYHQQLKDEGETDFIVAPTFRPDRGMEIENGDEYREWVKKLEAAADTSISNFKEFLEALQSRHDAFHELGCRASDHGVEVPHSEEFSDAQVDTIFQKVLDGKAPTEDEVKMFKSAFLYYCGVMDAEKGWVYQLHMGAIRNNNTRMLKKLGRDTGFDSIGDFELAIPLSRLLNRLDSEDNLPKTILYNNNPRDNELMATMLGNFQDGSVPGKLQHGPPWWFLDQKNGIEEQLESLSNMGVISEFIGMTTDSRSFLSYPRHEYYRRVLCNVIGDDIEKGLIPADFELVGKTVKDISFANAKNYFGFDI